MFTFVIIISALIQGLVALFVLQKNPRGRTNILFFLLSAFLVAWATINFIITSNPSSSNQLLLYRLLFASVIAQNTCFFFFAHTYPDKTTSVSAKYAKLYLGLGAITLLVVLSPLVFPSVHYGPSGARPVTGPGMLLFVLHAVISNVLGLRSIYRRYTKSTGMARQQFRLIFFDSIILWGVVPITNFVISIATQTLFFARISPIYTLTFSSIIAYAIVAQKLFDIRAAVARSVTYILIVGTLTLVYGVLLFGVINLLLPGQENELLRQILSVILITPIAISFQTIKQFFDKVTNHFFYKDAYDTQDILDKLGTIAVSEIDLQKVLRKTRVTLDGALRSSFVEFILFKNDKTYFEAEAHDYKTVQQDVVALASFIKEQHEDLVVVDELGPLNPMREHFTNAGVALSLRLKTQSQTVGYIIFGGKKSGDVYSEQDKKLLVIVANELAIAIQNSLRFEEIQNFNVTLQAKVQEATKQLRKANEKLKQMDETKDDFISMASHQLRTPLTSIKGYISMVLEGDAGKVTAKEREMLGQAFFSSQRMVYLIADLLNVSRLKTGKFVIDKAPVNLAIMVAQELKQLQETAAAQHLKLTYEQPKSFPDLMLDETKTRQVIMNFVDNAIYYTPAGGHIIVRVIDGPTTVAVRVEDDGIGVSKTDQPHLFTKFYRASNARTARPDGTGLGLFMAKKVIIAEGGSLVFESEEGKGSTFGFTFSKSQLSTDGGVPLLKVAPVGEPVLPKS